MEYDLSISPGSHNVKTKSLEHTQDVKHLDEPRTNLGLCRSKNPKGFVILAGTWSNMSDEEIEKMKEEIRELRKKSTRDLMERTTK